MEQFDYLLARSLTLTVAYEKINVFVWRDFLRRVQTSVNPSRMPTDPDTRLVTTMPSPALFQDRCRCCTPLDGPLQGS